MNDQESARVLLYLTEAFRAEVTDGEIEIWQAHLADVDYDLGGWAAKRCVEGLAYFPKISEFKDACRAERRAREPKMGELDVPMVDRSPETMAKVKAAIAETKKLVNREEATSD